MSTWSSWYPSAAFWNSLNVGADHQTRVDWRCLTSSSSSCLLIHWLYYSTSQPITQIVLKGNMSETSRFKWTFLILSLANVFYTGHDQEKRSWRHIARCAGTFLIQIRYSGEPSNVIFGKVGMMSRQGWTVVLNVCNDTDCLINYQSF